MRPFLFSLALAAVSTTSTAQPDRSHLAALTVDELKLVYLDCERRAGQAPLGGTEAAHCSMALEELRERAFGGDFRRLLAWWQEQRRGDAKPVAKATGR